MNEKIVLVKQKIPALSIILVEPENPDNIGAVARAMKNMGLSDFRLVKPPKNWKRMGKKMAMSGLDVLQNAREFRTLKEAVEDVRLVIGTSRRRGPKRGQFLDFDQAVQKIIRTVSRARAALVFGKESKGLDNPSLRLCDWTVSIPANPDYPSLNLAQAVMVFAFSIFKQQAQTRKNEAVLPSKPTEVFVSKKEMQEVLAAFRLALNALGYDSSPRLPDRVENSFHRLLKRSGLLESEARMLKGLTRRIIQKLKN